MDSQRPDPAGWVAAVVACTMYTGLLLTASASTSAPLAALLRLLALGGAGAALVALRERVRTGGVLRGGAIDKAALLAFGMNLALCSGGMAPAAVATIALVTLYLLSELLVAVVKNII